MYTKHIKRQATAGRSIAVLVQTSSRDDRSRAVMRKTFVACCFSRWDLIPCHHPTRALGHHPIRALGHHPTWVLGHPTRALGHHPTRVLGHPTRALGHHPGHLENYPKESPHHHPEVTVCKSGPAASSVVQLLPDT